MKDIFETINSVNSLITQYEELHQQTLAKCHKLEKVIKDNGLEAVSLSDTRTLGYKQRGL